MERYKPYVPQDRQELVDLLGSMVLDSPRFADTSGFFPGKNIETVYFALSEGLKAIQVDLGRERVAKLDEMAERTKKWFTAATDEDADEVWAGRNLLLEMIEIVEGASPTR